VHRSGRVSPLAEIRPCQHDFLSRPALHLWKIRDGEEAMNGYVTDIERDTLENEDYRRVLYTGEYMQLVLMTLQPGEEIGLETHEGHDQFIRIESGTGYAQLDGERHDLEDGSIVVIPSGANHNVVNSSATEPLRLYTLYSPPEHPDGTVQPMKADETE
jgi:mannose-6-phosphate isomerase-like protein (cupin superfamily)